MPGAPAYVFDFTQGSKDQKDLLGGKGANLAEMTNLGLPVPPGFTITTEACRSYLAKGKEPGELRVQVTMALRHLEDSLDRRLGDRHDPLLVSVRSGAKFSMPGMMETVLNIGLNDASVDGLAEASGNERFAWDSYRRLIQMFGKTVLDIEGERFADALDDAKKRKGVALDTELEVEDLQALVAAVQGHRARGVGARLPAAPARAARSGDPRGVRLVEHRPRAALPAPGADPARPGHRGQHVHDGVRQPGRGVGHRRRVHPRPVHRALRRRTATTSERAGRGRRRRHPQHAAARRPEEPADPRRTPS